MRFLRGRCSRFAVLCLGVIAGILSAAPAVAAPALGPSSGLYPAADPDPFYAPPVDLASKKPGEVVRTRPMPPLLTFPGVDIWMAAFRSTNSEGKPILATTTVMLPPNRSSNGPLLSYQHIINGLGTECAVSRELYTSDPNLIIREAPALNVVLQRGWKVALPDHLGPTSAYGAAKLGGQITLDGIRAVQHVARFGLAESPVALAGYSGGGMATAWAAALAPAYAPELNIVGAAEGGVPTNLLKMGDALGLHPHPAFGLAAAAAIGLGREYPDRLPILSLLNDRGLAMARQMSNGCTNDILAAGAGHSVAEVTKSTSFMSDPGYRRVASENSLEDYPGVPKTPIFEWHSPTDVLIPVDSINTTMRRYCAAGVKVQAELVPSPDHLTTAVLGVPSALNYLDARFRGVPAPSNC
ncbi:lipase family protein [Speluncibacter jeojiensis]|uniref:lipase family protein n=1 Tax=Speluncibacter jeojiensis TaxID=2710754 RepID=UPI0038CDAB64